MHARRLRIITIALAAMLGAAGLRATLGEEAVPALARQVFERHREAVVKVTGVAHIRLRAVGRSDLNMPERDDKVRADGTLVGPSGLVALSLSAIDPSASADAEP